MYILHIIIIYIQCIIVFIYCSVYMLIYCHIDFPNDGEVRLYYNYHNALYYRGLVEVYLNGVWGTVANDGSWSLEDGEVVCRQLGIEVSSECSSYHG